jgi:serine/threonine protein kinase
LTGLVLRPKGQPIRSHIRSGTFDENCLDQFSSQLKEALDFMHEKKVVHNDVSPKNIVVHSVDGAPWQVCLVDFGCASKPDESKTGFVGTPLYANQEIFERYPGKMWCPDSKHDVFSLGLTMSALLNKGEPDWDMTPFPVSITDANRNQFDEAVKKRCEQAVAKITVSTCKRKDEWVLWITDNENLLKSRKRKKNNNKKSL